MKFESVFYFIVTFFFSLLMVSTAFNFSENLVPVLRAPVMAIGLVMGLVVPSMTFVYIDSLVKKNDKRNNDYE